MNHCIVVGAGIIGMMTAYKLMQQGCRVTIVDRGEAGHESSWAGGGILSALHPWHYPPEAIALVEESLNDYAELIQTLKSISGIDPEFIRSGAIFVDRESIVQGQVWAQKNLKSYECLNQFSLSEIEPQLSRFQEAILFPDVFQVRTPRLLKALKKCLLIQGATIEEFLSVQALAMEGGVVTGVKTSRGIISAPTVILSCGAWTAELLKQQQLRPIPVRPVRGQMLLLEAKRFPLRHVVLDERYYLIPRQDGKVLVGSTMEEVGFQNETTHAARQELFAAAMRLMPSSAECEITHQWAGLRPGSPSGIPSVARHPQLQGLYVNAGHFRNGVAMATGAAQLLSDLVMGKSSGINQKNYDIFVDE